MARNVDGNDLLKTKVPFELGLNKRSDEPARSSIDVDGAIDTALHEEVIDLLRVFILASVGGTPGQG